MKDQSKVDRIANLLREALAYAATRSKPEEPFERVTNATERLDMDATNPELAGGSGGGRNYCGVK